MRKFLLRIFLLAPSEDIYSFFFFFLPYAFLFLSFFFSSFFTSLPYSSFGMLSFLLSFASCFISSFLTLLGGASGDGGRRGLTAEEYPLLLLVLFSLLANTSSLLFRSYVTELVKPIGRCEIDSDGSELLHDVIIRKESTSKGEAEVK